jgi:dUTP pyrophosphatase
MSETGMTEIGIGLMVLGNRDPALPLPQRASAGASGLDVCANLPLGTRKAGLELWPGERALIPTGIALAIPAGCEVQMRPRSGLALHHGVTLLNAPGTIDSDYRGEVGVILINHGTRRFVVEHGMRVAQMVVAPVSTIRFRMVTFLDDTHRGRAGFGSTGTAATEGA